MLTLHISLFELAVHSSSKFHCFTNMFVNHMYGFCYFGGKFWLYLSFWGQIANENSMETFSIMLETHQREIRDFCLPPVWNLRAVILIPLFYIYLLFLFFCLVLSLFLSYPFLLLANSPDFFFPKPSFSKR